MLETTKRIDISVVCLIRKGLEVGWRIVLGARYWKVELREKRRVRLAAQVHGHDDVQEVVTAHRLDHTR